MAYSQLKRLMHGGVHSPSLHSTLSHHHNFVYCNFIATRHYRARYQIKTKPRMMPMHKWLRTKKRNGKMVEEAIITDTEAAKQSQAMSELSLIDTSLLDDAQEQNILSISDRAFQKYFLPAFNKSDDAKQLREVLSHVKSKMSTPTTMHNLSNMQQFEHNILRLAYHACIARCSFAPHNDTNDGTVDLDSIQQFFSECKSLELVNVDTYQLVLEGYINAHNATTTTDEAAVHANIVDLFQDFEMFIDSCDPVRPNILFKNAHTDRYRVGQTQQYSKIYSAYITYLCARQNKQDLATAIQVFYHCIGRRFVVPSLDTQYLLMREIAAESSDALGLKQLFHTILEFAYIPPPIDWFNEYLDALSKFGRFEDSIEVLRVLVKQEYHHFYDYPQAPIPNVKTFEIVFKNLKMAMEKNRLTQDVGCRKAAFVLRQMKELKIGTPQHIYVLLYEMLGVAWWEHLPWHLRLLNRPEN